MEHAMHIAVVNLIDTSFFLHFCEIKYINNNRNLIKCVILCNY